MDPAARRAVAEAKRAALHVLLHNAHGPFQGLMRTAGWGYPEPYTRDLMISSLGIMVSGEQRLVQALRRVLEALARNQTRLGHIPSLAHNPHDRGASDTTPLFLIGLHVFRQGTGEKDFLEEAARRAMVWMEYQSPDDYLIVAQQPTSDWRDEQWVWGYGLYVNALVHLYLRLYGRSDQAAAMRRALERFEVTKGPRNRPIHAALALRQKPYYAFYSYKRYRSERFDLLGNSLAILGGMARPSRASRIIRWVEAESAVLRARGDLAVDVPPCLIPYITPDAPDWREQNEQFNRPGEYHNGGVWPFIGGFYVAAAVAAGKLRTAERCLLALTRLVRAARALPPDLPQTPAGAPSASTGPFGFNEWHRAQDGTPQGQDWQTWSAAMYLYAAACVEQRRTPFLDAARAPSETRPPAAGDRPSEIDPRRPFPRAG